MPFDVAEDGRYEMVAQLAHSPDYGDYTVELDGQADGELRPRSSTSPAPTSATPVAIDAYFTETYVAEDHLIGWAHAREGPSHAHVRLRRQERRRVRLQPGHRHDHPGALGHPTPWHSDFSPCIRRQRYVQLESVAPPTPPKPRTLLTALTATRRRGARGRRLVARAASARSPRRLRSSPRSTTGSRRPRPCGAGPARQRGTAAAPARDALLARLGDSEVGVRMMAAQALGRLHDPSAIDALVAACRVPDQQVHVLRSLADALGAMGPAAAAALPVLRDLTKIPRVEWAAKAAIRRINGQP